MTDYSQMSKSSKQARKEIELGDSLQGFETD